MKKLIKKIDNSYLGGIIQWTLANRFGLIQLQKLALPQNHKIVIRYQKDLNNPLAQLCDRYGSDKGEIQTAGHPYPWPSHTYADFYSLLFGARRAAIRYLFECGIGTNNPGITSSMGEAGKPGASLRLWRDYFPNAEIVGADIDKDILFSENRIKTFHVDQTKPASVQALWQAAGVEHFDVMIDDGLHVFEAGICLFENSIHKLANGGIYIIEDVKSRDLLLYQRYFADKNYRVNFINLFRHDVLQVDNNLVVIYG